MEFAALINKMAIFVVLMLIGYLCARRGVTDANYTRTTSKLVINVFMCATILKSAFAMETAVSLATVAVGMLAMCLTIAFCFLVGFAVTRLLRIEREHAAQFELLVAVGNAMFIGVPVAESVLGPLAVFYIAMSAIPFNVLLYSYGIWLLLDRGEGVKLRFRDVLSIPLVTSLLAILIFLLKPPIPTVVRELVDTMSGATMPLSMLVIGASLGGVKLVDAFRNKKLYLASFARLLLTPILLGLLTGLLHPDPMLRMTCIIVAACPSAILVSILSIQYGKDYVFSSQGILQSTALSMLTIPLILYLFA